MTAKQFLPVLFLPVIALSQGYRDLAADHAGEQVAFVSFLRPIDDSPSNRAVARLYVSNSGSPRRVAETPAPTPTVNCGFPSNSLARPVFVPGAGSFAYHEQYFCLVRFPIVPPEPAWVARIGGHPRLPDRIQGQLQFSANGKFAAIQPDLGGQPRLIDLESGAETKLPSPGMIASARHALGDRGEAVFIENSGAYVWSGGTRREIASEVKSCGIDPLARYAFCHQRSEFIQIDLATGSQTVLATGERFEAHVSSDGARLLLNDSGRVRVFAMPEARETHTLLKDAYSATISGDGRVAFAASAGGSLWRFDLETGSKEEWLPPAPAIESFAPHEAVAGSLVTATGRFPVEQPLEAPEGALPQSMEQLQVLLDGDPLPIFKVGPRELRFQIPWDAVRTDRRRIEVRHERNPHFLMALQTTGVIAGPAIHIERELGSSILAVAAHEDFRGPVNASDPARAGETIHLYATGLGSVTTGFNHTGVRTPPGSHPAVQIPACKVAPVRSNYPLLFRPAEVTYAGLAGTLVGLYQIDIALPQDLDTGRYLDVEAIVISCESGGSSAEGFLPAMR